MAHQWHSGVLTSSSWHGLEEIGVMPDAESMIAHGERVNAWPTGIEYSALRTVDGVDVEGYRAIVASFATAEKQSD